MDISTISDLYSPGVDEDDRYVETKLVSMINGINLNKCQSA